MPRNYNKCENLDVVAVVVVVEGDGDYIIMAGSDWLAPLPL